MLEVFKLLPIVRAFLPSIFARKTFASDTWHVSRERVRARMHARRGTNARVSEIDFRIRRFNRGRREKRRMIAKYH